MCKLHPSSPLGGVLLSGDGSFINIVYTDVSNSGPNRVVQLCICMCWSYQRNCSIWLREREWGRGWEDFKRENRIDPKLKYIQPQTHSFGSGTVGGQLRLNVCKIIVSGCELSSAGYVASISTTRKYIQSTYSTACRLENRPAFSAEDVYRRMRWRPHFPRHFLNVFTIYKTLLEWRLTSANIYSSIRYAMYL